MLETNKGKDGKEGKGVVGYLNGTREELRDGFVCFSDFSPLLFAFCFLFFWLLLYEIPTLTPLSKSEQKNRNKKERGQRVIRRKDSQKTNEL